MNPDSKKHTMTPDQERKKLFEGKEKEGKAIREGIRILNLMFATYKVSKIYKDNNVLVQEQSSSLQKSIENSLEFYDDATFLLRQNSLYFNGVKLKFSFATYHLFQFLSKAFQLKEIGRLSFQEDMDSDQLMKFIHLLWGKNEEKSIPLKEFKRQLGVAGIQKLTIDKLPPIEKSKSKDKDSANVYFLSMTHLKEIFKMHQENRVVPLLTTKRLIQTLFTHLIDNEAFVTGLTTIKNFDEYTLNHSVNVCILALSLGKRLGLNRRELVDLGLAAFFHDMGKLDIPKDILLKPGKLDEAEREVIEKHPSYGAEILANMRTTSNIPLRAIHVALEHHAHEDKRGYPKYTKKNQINLFSKIVKITDVFDALTTHRPYRKKDFTREEAIELMLDKMKDDFDAILFKVFINLMSSLPVGSLVLLTTGELGIVNELNPEAAQYLRPKVKIITDRSKNKIDGPIADLMEKDPVSGSFSRTIVKPLSPSRYNIKVSDYFMARAQ